MLDPVTAGSVGPKDVNSILRSIVFTSRAEKTQYQIITPGPGFAAGPAFGVTLNDPIKLQFAPGVGATAWVETYDRLPSLLPRWPRSRLMTLVAVMSPWEGETQAFVITQPTQLRFFYGKDPTLFYSIPRDVVLAPAVCPPGLTPQSWG